MRPFTKVLPDMFEDERWLKLDWVGRCVYFYFLAGKHQNSAGAYKIPDMYAAADLKCEVAEYIAARRALVSSGLILFDETTSEVYVLGWFEENAITNEKHAAGTFRHIDQIRSDQIRSVAEAEYTVSCDAFYSRKADRSPPKLRSYG
jgi:hypothetical protein